MRGGSDDARLRMPERTRLLGRDRLRGRLFDIGAWPAFLPGSCGTVHVELALVVDEDLLDELDRDQRAVHGHPDGRVFERRAVRTIGGYDGQTYVWLGSGLAAPRITHGDWMRHVLESGKRT